MASKKQHLEQARINEEVFDFFGGETPKYIDWAITFLFYVAVHQAEAAFACIKGVCHSEVCKGRDEDMSYTRYRLVKNYFGKNIAFCFNNLEQASKNVRYLINDYQQYYDRSVLSDFFRTDLKQIISATKAVYGKANP